MGDKTLKSPYPALPPCDLKTVPEFLLNQADFHARNGKTDWLIDGLTDERHSYKDFSDETGKVASKFFKQGLRKGDFVHYMITDMSKLHILTNGVWRGNGYLRVSYPEDDEETVLTRVQETKSRWMICDPGAAQLCLSVADKCEWKTFVVVVGTTDVPPGCLSFEEYLNDDGSEIPAFELTEDDIAVILCTSGSTGPSKGAVLTHKAMVMNIRLISLFPFTENKPNLVASKGVHISGTVFPLAVLASGNTGVVLSRVDKQTIMEVVHKYKPGFVYGFTSFLLALCSPEAKTEGLDFSSVEVIMTAGSPVTPAIKNTLMTLPNVRDFMILYGLTENLSVSYNVDLSENPHHPTLREMPEFSVGKPAPGVLIQVRDAETLTILGPNQKGEICVKSDCSFQGYFGNPESTKNTFIDDQWVKTGDLGHYDENGYLFITDRLKEIFKYYNNHISPTEIEGVIAQHSAVNEVCVVGVPDEGGQVPRAFITLSGQFKEKVDHGKLSEEIKEFANGKLSSYKKLLGGLYILKELPKGNSGKVTRNLVGQIQIPS